MGKLKNYSWPGNIRELENPDNPSTYEPIVAYAKAVAAKRQLESGKIAYIGRRTPGMTPIAFDEIEITRLFGPQTITYGWDEIEQELDKIPNTKVKEEEKLTKETMRNGGVIMKKLSLGFPVVLFFLVTIFAYADLIAHWPMNEGSGKEIKDVVGKGGTGKFVGNPKWVGGMVGKALEFATGNYVQVESNPDLKPKSITVTMWVYFNDVSPPRQDFFSKSDDYALSLHEWGNDGKIWPIITSAGDWVVVSGKTQIEAKRWYHVALVYGEKSKKLMSYVDGSLDASIDAPAGLEQRIGGPLTLGTYTDRFLKGMLDEVKIWNEALPEDKIKTDMKGATPVNSSGKLAVTWGKIKLKEQ